MDLSSAKVMGILNVTPDSFHAPSRATDLSSIQIRLDEMLASGADLIDVGGCSTRPGSVQPSEEEEIRRLRPALTLLRDRYPDVVVSVDTYRSSVAKMSVEEYGVHIINDISGGTLDSDMFRTVSSLGVAYVLSHIQGTPSDMSDHTSYNDLLNDILLYFSRGVQHLRDLGQKDIIIDPGFGFGKSVDQNYELLSNLHELQILELPILAGISRKSMIYKLLGISPEESLNGTSALHMVCLQQGCNILRVHDVKACVEVVKLYYKLNEQHKNYQARYDRFWNKRHN